MLALDIDFVINKLNSVGYLQGQDFLDTVEKCKQYSEKESRFYLLDLIHELQSECSWCARHSNRTNYAGFNIDFKFIENPVMFITDEPDVLDNHLGNLLSNMIDLLVINPDIQKDFEFLTKHGLGETSYAVPKAKKIEINYSTEIKVNPCFQTQNKELKDFYTSGQVFSSLLEDLNIERENVYITSVLGCPNYSENGSEYSPKVKEVSNCVNWLDMKIRLLRPRYIVALGSLPSKYLFKSDFVLKDISGKVLYNHSLETNFVCTYSPGIVVRYRNSNLKETYYNKIIEDIKNIND